MDSLLVAIAYGKQKISLSLPVCIVLSLTSTLLLGLSFLCAASISVWIPPILLSYLSFLIFFLLGLHCFIQDTMKSYFKKKQNTKTTVHFHGIEIVFHIYLDETSADLDHSHTLSIKEAFYLGIVLSIDSFMSGFAYGVSSSIPLILVLCFLMNISFLYYGSVIGNKFLLQTKEEVPWLSACLFFLLALYQLFG